MRSREYLICLTSKLTEQEWKPGCFWLYLLLFHSTATAYLQSCHMSSSVCLWCCTLPSDLPCLPSSLIVFIAFPSLPWASLFLFLHNRTWASQGQGFFCLPHKGKYPQRLWQYLGFYRTWQIFIEYSIVIIYIYEILSICWSFACYQQCKSNLTLWIGNWPLPGVRQ